MKLDEVLKKYREKSYSERDKGARFELFKKDYFGQASPEGNVA